MEELLFPFDSKQIVRQKNRILHHLMSMDKSVEKKKIAVMCGGTFDQMEDFLRMFLLNVGICPEFYASEPERYQEELLIRREGLDAFQPDLIWFFTGIHDLPESATEQNAFTEQASHWQQIWDVALGFHCPVIQNNFEYPISGEPMLCGLADSMNAFAKQYAEEHKDFHILDVHFLSAGIGLDRWFNRRLWYEARYALDLFVMPDLAYALAQKIRNLFCGGRKVIITDLDGTIWSGILAEDGVHGLEMGEDTVRGRVFRDIQCCLKKVKQRGIMLCIASKNDRDDVIEALKAPDQILRAEDFAIIQANWNPKNKSVETILAELNQFPEYAVFLDDTPQERELVRSSFPGIIAPDFDSPEELLAVLERGGYFQDGAETVEDANRALYYLSEMKRKEKMETFSSEEEYLRSLALKLYLSPLSDNNVNRVFQMHTRINRFNLSNKLFTQEELRDCISDPDAVTLVARVEDRFGDYGIVSCMLGKKTGRKVSVKSWLLSCRAFQRGIEAAMLNEFVRCCREIGAEEVTARYAENRKNKQMPSILSAHGFTTTNQVTYSLKTADYVDLQHYILVSVEKM